MYVTSEGIVTDVNAVFKRKQLPPILFRLCGNSMLVRLGLYSKALLSSVTIFSDNVTEVIALQLAKVYEPTSV